MSGVSSFFLSSFSFDPPWGESSLLEGNRVVQQQRSLSGLETPLRILDMIKSYTTRLDTVRETRLQIVREFSEDPPGSETQIPWLGNKQVSVREGIFLYHQRREELLSEMKKGKLTEPEFNRLYEEPRNAFFSKVMAAIRQHRMILNNHLRLFDANSEIKELLKKRNEAMLEFMMESERIPCYVDPQARKEFELKVDLNFTPHLGELERAASKIQRAFREYNARIKPHIETLMRKIDEISDSLAYYQMETADLALLESQLNHLLEEGFVSVSDSVGTPITVEFERACNMYMARYEKLMQLPEARAVELLAELNRDFSELFTLIEEIQRLKKEIQEKETGVDRRFFYFEESRKLLKDLKDAFPNSGRVLEKVKRAERVARQFPRLPYASNRLIQRADELRNQFEKLGYEILELDLDKGMDLNSSKRKFTMHFDKIDRECQKVKSRMMDLGIDYDFKPHEFYRNDTLRLMNELA